MTKPTYNKTIDHTDLLRHLHYDPSTGIFIRLRRAGNRSVGSNPGTVANTGYLVIQVLGGMYLAHRLAYFYMNGSWPTDQIDHINGDRLDNRWVNFREVTQDENSRNHGGQPNRRTSRYRGIKRVKGSQINPWMARGMVDRKEIYLGVFPTQEEAFAARVKWEKEMFGSYCTSSSRGVANA